MTTKLLCCPNLAYVEGGEVFGLFFTSEPEGFDALIHLGSSEEELLLALAEEGVQVFQGKEEYDRFLDTL